MTSSLLDEKPSNVRLEDATENEFDQPPPAEASSGAEEFRWDISMCLNLTALMACYFSSTWGLLVPSSAIHFIVNRFPEDANIAAWIAAAATIPNCVIQAFMGEISDVLGRKPFLLAGMALGLAGALISSRASSLEMVIGGQVLNGCGLTLGFLAIPLVSEIVPKDRRPVIQGIAGLTAGIATLLGPILQGVFIERQIGGQLEGWRTGFYLCAGFYALTFVLLVLFYYPSPRYNPENESITARLLHFDWPGVFMVAAGLVLFLVGLQYGGNPYKWTSAIVLCTLIIGGTALVVFGFWEWKGRDDGLFNHQLFAHRNFALSVALNFVGGIVLFGGQAYLPQEIASLFTTDAVMTGVYNIPFNAFSIVGALVAGVMMSITKEARGLVVAAFALLLVGGGLMAVMEPRINYAAWFFPTSMLGFGVGIQTSILTVVVGICTPNRYIATASSLVASVRALGGSIGIVIFSQIFSSKTKSILIPKVTEAILNEGLPVSELEDFLTAASSGNETALMSIKGVSAAVIQAYSSAHASGLAECYRFIWYSLIPFSAVTLFLSLFIKSTKAQMTPQVAAGIERGGH